MQNTEKQFNIQELERIAVEDIKSISDKAKMVSFITMMKGSTPGGQNDNKIAQAVAEREKQTADLIADWIDRANPGATVRAKKAQKIAQSIRTGEWKTQQ